MIKLNQKFSIFSIFFFFSIILNAQLPDIRLCINKLKGTDLFDENSLSLMMQLQSNDSGFSCWCGAFSDVCNSDFNLHEKVVLLVYWLSLGIQQTNKDDETLNKEIRSNLEDLKENSLTKNLKDPCIIEDLEREFESRSNPSSPIGSPKKSEK